MNQQATLPILSPNIRPFSSNSSNRPTSSVSVHRIHSTDPTSNKTFPAHLPLKKLKPEPWQRLFDGEKRQVYSAQGLTMKKNKQNVDAIINEDFFNLTDEPINFDDKAQRSLLPPPIQAHIDHLCEQIDDLAVQLAEERMNFRIARTKADETHNNLLQNQNQQFQEFFQQQTLEHQKELENQHEKHLNTLHEQQNESHKREEHLKNELEFVKTSHHAYKINLDKENAEQLQSKINEAIEGVKKELKAKEDEMAKKINDAVMKERKSLALKQKMEIENLKKQHQKEIDIAHKSFSDSAYDRSRIETLSKELTSTKLELEDTKDRAVNLAVQLKDLEIKHVETTRELHDFRTRFDEKTKEIERRYIGKMDQLHLENADLRNLYMKKCAELVDERALSKQKIEEHVEFTRKQLKQKLLNTRISSAIPLSNDRDPRRLSTCATASQYELSSTRCRSAYATVQPISSAHNELSMDSNHRIDYTVHNTRRETKLRRRGSVPITEGEQDVVRYLASTSSRPTTRDSLSSKYNFENEPTMLNNLTLEDLQQTFKLP
ncbi:unnamed protein product [Adineta steineri]|uniref:Uncharacterized protein n=2 Tax=Adineta steineri TaxID=433720 RepID=A0A815EP33_9BILA|nr:unnamed protein product [Adineta steineri]